MNCDNRITASAARFRYESQLAGWISHKQQGFLPGRSLLSNLIDVEHDCMITSLQSEAGACILLDFARAFPSISQEFMIEILQYIGLPDYVLNTVKCFYDNSYCIVRQGVSIANGFQLRSGVRQGCPLSPLLYATIAEILLAKTTHDSPNTYVKAYADDTALVLWNFWEEAPILQRVFS